MLRNFVPRLFCRRHHPRGFPRKLDGGAPYYPPYTLRRRRLLTVLHSVLYTSPHEQTRGSARGSGRAGR